jgi:hypothetical protein
MKADKTITVRLDPMTVVDKYFNEELIHDRIWEAAMSISELYGKDPLENEDFPKIFYAVKDGFFSYKDYTGHIAALGALMLTTLLDTGYVTLTIGPDDADENELLDILNSLSAKLGWGLFTTLAQSADAIGLVENERFTKKELKNLRSIPFNFRLHEEDDTNGNREHE